MAVGVEAGRVDEPDRAAPPGGDAAGAGQPPHVLRRAAEQYGGLTRSDLHSPVPNRGGFRAETGPRLVVPYRGLVQGEQQPASGR